MVSLAVENTHDGAGDAWGFGAGEPGAVQLTGGHEDREPGWLLRESPAGSGVPLREPALKLLRLLPWARTSPSDVGGERQATVWEPHLTRRDQPGLSSEGMDGRTPASTTRLGQAVPTALVAIESMTTDQRRGYSERLAELLDAQVRARIPPAFADAGRNWDLVDILDDQAWTASESAGPESSQYPAKFALARAVAALVYLTSGNTVECLAEATYEALAGLDDSTILRVIADSESSGVS